MPHSELLSQVFQVGFWCIKKQIWSTHWIDWEYDLENKDYLKMKTTSKTKMPSIMKMTSIMKTTSKRKTLQKLRQPQKWRPLQYEDCLNMTKTSNWKDPDLEDRTLPELTQPLLCLFYFVPQSLITIFVQRSSTSKWLYPFCYVPKINLSNIAPHHILLHTLLCVIFLFF